MEQFEQQPVASGMPSIEVPEPEPISSPAEVPESVSPSVEVPESVSPSVEVPEPEFVASSEEVSEAGIVASSEEVSEAGIVASSEEVSEAEPVVPSEEVPELVIPSVSEGEEAVTVEPSPLFPIEPVKKRYGKVDITPKGEIRFYATGRRKESVARVWLIPGGTGQITVNDRPLMSYVHRISLYEQVLEPLRVTNTLGMFDVKATTKGGGLTGQAGALRHGIARALAVWNDEMRPALRRFGLLTRDPRTKERKKYGYKRARRGFQFRKR